MKKIYYLLIVTCLYKQVTAQTGKLISLKDALKMAVHTYPSIKMKSALVRFSAYSVMASKRDYLPAIIPGQQFNFGSDNNINGSSFPFYGTVISTSAPVNVKNNYSPIAGNISSLVVDWHAFTFGKIRQEVSYSTSLLHYRGADFENEIFQQQVKTADAY